MGRFKPDNFYRQRPTDGTILKTRHMAKPTERLQNGALLEGDVDTQQKTEETQDYQRGTWSGRLDFILSIVGYSVGVSNIWRFPYLCIRNGGGAFLIPFFFFLLFCGIPLFFLELCLGQFSGTSSLFVWKFCPLFKGLGFLMVIVSAIMCWYYIMVIAWVLYFLAHSFASELPWTTCGNWWNTEGCITSRAALNYSDDGNTSSALNHTAAQEFWQHNVLEISSGLDDPGSVRWQIVVALLVAWILVFLCLMKGIKTVGKVVYVTALLPYLLLTIFLIRGLMLPGAIDGIIYYLKPDFRVLLGLQVWLEAGIQVFYSLGPAWGGLITMSSYNKFDNNCLRDAFIGSLADGLTSFYGGFVIFAVLGFMANEANMPIEKVATSGPGLALVAYPEAISKLPLPQLWAILFFLMLLTLGIDSQFGTFETVSSGLVDAFPKQLANKKVLVTAGLCCCFFVLGLPFTTNGGMYVYQIVDWYAASLCVLFTCFLECFLIGWIYGAERFSRDIEMMTGSKPPLLLRICWCFITPIVMLVALVITIATYESPTYDGYSYPGYARAIGMILAVLPIIPIPVCMVTEIFKAEGTLIERIKFLLKPAADWGPHVNKYRQIYRKQTHPEGRGFVDALRVNLLGSTEVYTTGTV